MVKAASGLGFGPVLVFSLSALAGCTGETPRTDLPAPDVSKVVVFFPINGRLVYGRAAPGAVQDARITHVCVREALENSSDCRNEVGADGSFSFLIRATSGAVLELSGSEDPDGKSQGDYAFVRVPATPLPKTPFVCCKNGDAAIGVCTPRTIVEEGSGCYSLNDEALTKCSEDRQCGALGYERLNFDPASVSVTRPDAANQVTVKGTAIPRTLITIENRGQRNVMTGGQWGSDPGFRRSMVTADDGSFEFRAVPAQGDDELVIQIRDLNDFRSHPASILVPDAPLRGLDIINVEPWEPLTPGLPGTVVVRFSPFGSDRTGLCPDHTADPVLCLGGGLRHADVTVQASSIDGYRANMTPIASTPSSGTHGDPRSGPMLVAYVVDMSQNSNKLDPPIANGDTRRIKEIESFIKRQRSRDRVAVIAYGGTTEPSASGWVDLWNPDVDRGSLMTVVRQRPIVGEPAVFRGIATAGALIRRELRGLWKGHIVVVAVDHDLKSEASSELRSTASNIVAPRNGDVIPVSLITLAGSKINPALEDMVESTGGVMDTRAANPGLWCESFSNLGANIFGSFALLYAIDVPAQPLGKSARIELEVGLTINGPFGLESLADRTKYDGPLAITNATGEGNLCP